VRKQEVHENKNKYSSLAKRENMYLKLQIFTSDEIVGSHDSWKFLLMSSSSFLLLDQYIDKEIHT